MTLSSLLFSFSSASASDASGDPARRFELPNGLLVVLHPSRKARTVSVHLAVRTGSSDEAQWLGSGLSHFVEHMLFKGTAVRKPGQIEEAVRSMGGSTNAYTSYDLTVFYLNCLSEHTGEALDLFADVAFKSVFPVAEFKKEREVILAEFRMNEDNIDRKADLEMWKTVFREHPYGVPVIGHRSLFEQATREDLLAFYHKFYVPNNMVLTVAGDIDVQKTEEAVRRLFSAAPRGPMQRAAKSVEPEQISPRSSELREVTSHARLVLGFPGVALAHPDSAVLDVVSYVLGEGSSSRLNQAVKERAGAALDISSFNATLKDAGLFGIHAVALTGRLEEVRGLALAEARKLAQEGVSEAELERVKNQVLASYFHGRETHAALAHDYLTNEVYVGDYRFSLVYVDRIKRLAPEDVRRAAALYLREDALSEVYVYPKDSAAGAAAGREGLNTRPELKKTVLPNGLTLLVERDASSPDITLQLAMHAGLRYETPETNGASQLVASLLTRGTAEHSQSELASIIEGWGGAAVGFSGQNSLGLTMTALSAYRDQALRLFARMILEPAFEESEIAKAKILQEQELLGRADNIFAYVSQSLRRHMFLKHPYGMDPLGTEASLAGLRRQDLAAFHRRILSPKRAVLVISGDVDPAEAERLAAELFGSFKGSPADESRPEPEAIGEVRSVTDRVRREQAVVTVAFGGMRVSDERRYAFEVLNAVMNGSAGRLYNRIRGQSGLSYVTGSNLALGVDPGYFTLYASVQPSRADETLNMILKEVDDLRKNGITDAELESARTQLIGDHEHVLESKGSRASELAFSELYGTGLDGFRDYPEKIRAVSRVDVQNVIRDFVDPRRSLRLTVTPSGAVQEKA